MAQPQKKEVAVTPKTIIDDVLAKIEDFQNTGELKIPTDYSPQNALKSAYLILVDTKTKDKKPVLEVCSQVSIANSLLDMVVQGLSPMKNQCYFIAYGNQLQLSRSYMGSIAVAKRVGMKSVVANVVYENDEFSYEIVKETGLKRILEHKQSMENIDMEKIRGAYAITTLEDGTTQLTIMTMHQIKNAWLQGAAKGKSIAHTNFTDEMCKKTVTNRACKLIINGSTDLMLNAASQSETDDKQEFIPEAETNQKIIEIVPEEQEVVVEEVKAETVAVEKPKAEKKVKKNF